MSYLSNENKLLSLHTLGFKFELFSLIFSFSSALFSNLLSVYSTFQCIIDRDKSRFDFILHFIFYFHFIIEFFVDLKISLQLVHTVQSLFITIFNGIGDLKLFLKYHSMISTHNSSSHHLFTMNSCLFSRLQDDHMDSNNYNSIELFCVCVFRFGFEFDWKPLSSTNIC